jgi:nitrogen fixation/metabolism regulation signal transduction histidine kinase
MKKVCAWCKLDMGIVSGIDDKYITHGICDDCSELMLWPHRSTVMSFLDTLNAPIIVVDSNGNACTANSQARKILRKDLKDIIGLRGGVIFNCAFSNLPEGCGFTVHCDGCTIRNTVMDTFMSGKSHLKVPAGLTRGTTEDRIEIQYMISTEKVEDTVLLRIDNV